MRTSDSGIELIKQSEGLKLTKYKDAVGLDTIGYGHRIIPPQTFANGITMAQADAILSLDVRAAELAVTQLVTVPLTQGQFDALVDFVFNLGRGNLKNSTLLQLLNAGHYDLAGAELLKWDHANGVVLEGLKARREAEYKLFTQPSAADLDAVAADQAAKEATSGI